MASTAAVPRINQSAVPNLMRMRGLPVIQHPWSKLGDHSTLVIHGYAPLGLHKGYTYAGKPSDFEVIGVTSSTPDALSLKPIFLSNSWHPRASVATPRTKSWKSKSAKVRKRAMACSKTDQEIMEIVRERLENGFEGMRHMFHLNDPQGGYSVSKPALLKIMYSTLGHIATDQFDRFLENIGLKHKDTISFDVFASRFKESEKIQKAWTNPVKRDYIAHIGSRAHPEEELRDCEVFEWGQLRTGPHAFHLLRKALKERKIDIRSILPAQCFMPDGSVDRLQLRHALSELSIYLTDVEFAELWSRFDEKKRGAVPLQRVYTLMDLDSNGEPVSSPPVEVMGKAPSTMTPPYRDPAKTYQKWVHNRHTSPHTMAKSVYDPRLTEGICGTPLGRSHRPKDAASQSPDKAGEETEREIAAELEQEKKPEAEAEARARIRSVINQPKGQGQFDNAVDTLFYKFEERYNHMMQAFKLFDISDDGYIMRIDFRRVLKEFGFPLTAMELGPFINGIGLSITHGQIHYPTLMNKLLNRSDGFVSRVLDSKIMSLQDGGTDDVGIAEGDNAIDVARRLVEFLHADYVKMAVSLLRLDKNDKAAIPPDEMRTAMENTLGSLTKKQWVEIEEKCYKDGKGNLRYIEFMQQFDKEPGAWNLVTHGQVTVPKQPMSYPTCKEAKDLEKAKQEVGEKPPRERKPGEDRRPEELREELKQFFADHLFDFDHQYHMLDRKACQNFSRWQFGALLRLCGFPITEKELEKLWMTMNVSDNSMTSYNSVVMEFAPGHEAFHLLDRKPQQNEEEGEVGAAGAGGAGDAAGETTIPADGDQAAGKTPEMGAKRTGQTPEDPHTYLQRIMKKLKPAVIANWERLKAGFRNLDPHGYGSVTYKQMQLLIDSCKSGLTRDDRNQICSQFDFRSNGRCNYLSFMKAFAEPRPPVSKFVYTPYTHKLEKQKVNVTPRLQGKLIKHHKNLRRAFQKVDKERTGELTVPEFKSIFRECTLPVSDEDFYHILSEFDKNMRGKLNYSEFLDVLMRM